MEVSFRYQPWEHFRAQRAISRNWSGHVWFYGITVWLPLVVLGLILYGNSVNSETPPITFFDIWFLVLAPAFFGLGIPLVQLYLAATHNRNEPWNSGEQTRLVTEEGFGIVGPSISMRLSWEGIQKVVETRRFFLFFSSRTCAYYIPKRVLPLDADVERIRDLVRTYAKRTKALRSRAAA